MNAVGGTGLGRYPACEDLESTVVAINGVKPDASGNFRLDLGECLRAQRSVVLTQSSPRQFAYASDSLSPSAARAAIQLHSDCKPCCDCDMYVQTYQGLKRQWGLWQEVADDVIVARDTMQRNIARWEAARECREAVAVRALIVAEPGCKLVLGGFFCNTNTACAYPVTLRFTVETSTGEGENCNQVVLIGADTGSDPHGGNVVGVWPVYDAIFDYADPSATSRIGFRLYVQDCLPTIQARVTLTVHYPTLLSPLGQDMATTPVIETPAWLDALWADAPPPTPIRKMTTTNWVALNPTNAYCASCYSNRLRPVY